MGNIKKFDDFVNEDGSSEDEYLLDFLNAVRDFVFDYYDNRGDDDEDYEGDEDEDSEGFDSSDLGVTFSDANEIMTMLEDDNRKPTVTDDKDAIGTLKTWGVNKTEMEAFLDDYLKPAFEWEEGEFEAKRQELLDEFNK